MEIYGLARVGSLVLNGTLSILATVVLFFNTTQTLTVENQNSTKSIDLRYEIVEYETEYIIDTTVPLFTEKVITTGEIGLITYVENNDEYITIKNPINEVIATGTGNPGTFIGELTGYGLDCVGCSNVTANGYRVPTDEEGNVILTYNDEEFGTVNILASDKRFPFGTIIRISNYKYGDENKDIIAVVMDRGGAIYDNKFDLMYATEASIPENTRFYNIGFTVLRWGW